MNQLIMTTGFERYTKATKRQALLLNMDHLLLWAELGQKKEKALFTSQLSPPPTIGYAVNNQFRPGRRWRCRQRLRCFGSWFFSPLVFVVVVPSEDNQSGRGGEIPRIETQ